MPTQPERWLQGMKIREKKTFTSVILPQSNLANLTCIGRYCNEASMSDMLYPVLSPPPRGAEWGEYAISHDVGWLVLLILMQGQCESLIAG